LSLVFWIQKKFKEERKMKTVKILFASFLIISIAAMLAVPALGMGKVLGKSAKAARAEQFTYKFIPPFDKYAVTKYIDMLDSRGEQISQIPDIVITTPEVTDPNYTLYMFMLNSSFVKVSGDDIMVPTATTSDEARDEVNHPWVKTADTLQPWDMDPSTGFTDTQIKTLLLTYGDRYASLLGNACQII